MSRADLLALSPDDLAALANRGLVKRAQKEVDAAQLTAGWDESPDGTLAAVWSDGVTCTLPGGMTVRDATCDCNALDICRHILRTILAWQQNQEGGGAQARIGPWDPGAITNETLEDQVPKTVRTRAKRLWSQGVLAELLRTSKPSARFHLPGHTVRFPVPGDARYVICSCAEPAPCVHSVLAIQAFRLLPGDQCSGIISEGPIDAAIDPAPLQAAETTLADALENGFANLGAAWRDRVRLVSADCASAGYSWPAQILEELASDFDRYIERDALFQPAAATLLLGEFLVRADAIRSGCGPVPQAFIRGLKSDRDSSLGSARFIGLGSTVEVGRKGSTIHTFLQDTGSGHVVTLNRNFSEDPDTGVERKAFHQLARTPAVKDASIALLAAGQLVTQGGKRSASGRLIIGRARAAVNPQNFEWQHLKAPVLVEDYKELATRLALLPPASFRPRQAAADFHVCPIAEIEHPHFNPIVNCVAATLRDEHGEEMLLNHSWSERGLSGAEALLAALGSGKKPLFVAGHVRSSGQGLVIAPTMLVLEEKGAAKVAILPWLDPPGDQPNTNLHPGDQLQPWRYDLARSLLEEFLLSGRRRLHSHDWPSWQLRIEELDSTGCHRMAALLRRIQDPELSQAAAFSALKLLTLAQNSHQLAREI